MRGTILLLAAMGAALLLSSGVALALNTINCEDSGRCVGTDRADLMKGTGGFNEMYGRDKADTLKGFGKEDALLGQRGDDELFGGSGQDSLLGGQGDDTLRGEDTIDGYFFDRSNWGTDTIIEASPSRNFLFLPFGETFTGTITTNLNSGSGPEVSNADGTSTVNWKGRVISFVIGSTGNDTVTGNDAANAIIDDADTDTDAISAGGGNDLIVVEDGAGDDRVECGEGADTVYFDEGDVLVVPDDCEEQNPPGPSSPEGRQVTTYRAGAIGGAPALVFGGHRP